ncbi:hypothetical protein [Nitratiruptor tergarcus]|uniref:Glycosyltransferase RgtA/B/C/D-like domain-containing protein n=1 Tax=Nitratiruptor tergarcus DSM 16512 TaxID=1069081 RepID=A0A1W1WTR2_9BACT|nr:hypothetical protein [Nitratiruptor tergarcus]SMC09592.1 hypothetical protein SAMN05660197_1409 [Nitratiruptor tergarcus DSM 16512]
MKKLKEKNYFVTILLVLYCLFYILPLYKVLFTTNDDANFYLFYIQHPNLFEESFKYITHVGTRPLFPFIMQIPYLVDNFFYIKSVQIAFFVFSILSVAFLLFKIFKQKSISYLYIVLFFIFMQFTFQHNILFAYPVYFHFAITLLALSMVFLIDFFIKKEIYYYFSSILFFVIPLFMYEMHIIYVVLYFIIIISFVKRVRKIIFYFSPFLLFSFILIVLDFYLKTHYPRGYAGTKIDISSLKLVVQSLIFHTSSAFPLFNILYLKHIIKHYNEYHFPHLQLPYLHFVDYIKAFIGGYLSFYFLKKIDFTKISSHLIYMTLIISFIYIFLPNLPISLTKKYQIWAQHLNFHYVTTHYSIIAMNIFILSFILLYIKQSSSYVQYNNHIKVSVVVIVFISLMNSYANRGIYKYLYLSSGKWKLMNTFIKSKIYKNIHQPIDISSFYIHEYSIMRLNKNYWNRYFYYKTGQKQDFKNGCKNCPRLLIFQNPKNLNEVLIFETFDKIFFLSYKPIYKLKFKIIRNGTIVSKLIDLKQILLGVYEAVYVKPKKMKGLNDVILVDKYY